MGLFSFLDGIKISKEKQGFRAYIDGVSVGGNKPFSANIDGVSITGQRRNLSANVDGIGLSQGGSRFRANVDGVGVTGKGGKSTIGLSLDNSNVQVSVDNILSRFSMQKLKKLLGLHKNFDYKYAVANLFTIYERLRSGKRLTLADIWSIFSGQPSRKEVPKSFGDFIRDWARSGMNPLKYIYQQFTQKDQFDVRRALIQDLKYKKLEIFATEAIVKQLLENRIENADSIELDNKLARRISKPEDLIRGVDGVAEVFSERMKQIARDLLDVTKNFNEIDRTQQKKVINQFRDRMRSELRKSVLGATIFGAGGLQRLTGSHLSSMSRVLNEQYRFLDGFVADLYAFGEQGKEINPNIVERAGRYANVARQAYYTSYQQKAIDTYGSAFYEKRILSPAENCPDCIDYAEMGCQPSGTLPLPTVGSVCMNNCKCEFVTFESKEMCDQSAESFGTDGEE